MWKRVLMLECMVCFGVAPDPITGLTFPSRTVGARNVKWLTKVSLSHEESPSFWQQFDYKVRTCVCLLGKSVGAPSGLKG